MKAKLIAFGELEIDGKRYTSDVVIERGRVRKRDKKPSKPYRDQYGHTPLSADEAIPWHAPRLIVGTGVYGRLPIMDALVAAAEARGIAIAAMPTKEACKLIRTLEADAINAVLHITC